MAEIYSIYNQFLNIFPSGMHWLVSLALAVLLIYAIFQIVKRNFIWLILLVILLPASLPILSNIWQNLVEFIRFLVTRR